MPEGLHILGQEASSIAPSIDALFWTLTVVSAFVTAGVACVILWFVVRYRRRHEDDYGVDTGEHMSLEIIWSAVPLLVFIGIFVWSTMLYLRIARPPADAMTIEVLGKQWMWKIQQPSGRKEINELHVPLGRPVKLQMTSEDVIHSFFVPAFRLKQDVLPGRYSVLWFTPTALGEYPLFCAQYCGTSHALMRGKVVVMAAADYDRWAANAAADDRPEAAGEKLFSQYGCMACHGQQAPTLAGVYGHEQVMQDGTRLMADEAYVRESILEPRAKIVAGYTPIMPSYDGQLSEEQIYQLLAYIKSLGAATRPAAQAPAGTQEAPR